MASEDCRTDYLTHVGLVFYVLFHDITRIIYLAINKFNYYINPTQHPNQIIPSIPDFESQKYPSTGPSSHKWLQMSNQYPIAPPSVCSCPVDSR